MTREQAWEEARGLLLACLPPKQVRNLKRRGWFEITSNKGRRWRIHTGSVIENIALMAGPEGRRVEAFYCAGPGDSCMLPYPDIHLAQALAIAADEDAFRAVANRYDSGDDEEDI